VSDELPPLPEHAITKQYDSAGNWSDCHPYYTAEQMQAYARTAVAAALSEEFIQEAMRLADEYQCQSHFGVHDVIKRNALEAHLRSKGCAW
jgi:hypothetical protein